MKNHCILFNLLFVFAPFISTIAVNGQLLNEQSKDVFQVIDSLNESAFEIKRSDVARALSMLDTTYSYALKANYKKGIATSLLYSGGIFYQNGLTKKALSNYYKSFRISNEIKDTFNIARAKQQIGNAYKENGQNVEAEKLYKEAIDFYKLLRRDEEVININNYLGLIEIQQRQFSSARNYFQKALHESRSINYKYGEKKALYNLGLLEKQKGDFKLAVNYFNSALVIDRQKNDKYGMSLIKNELSEIAHQQQLYTESVELAQQALEDAKSNKAQLLITRSIENIIKAFESQNKLQEVATWQSELIKTQKELFDNEKNYAANFLDILQQQQDEQLEAQKQARIAEQEVRISNIIIAIVAGALLILAFLSYLTFQSYKKAQKFSAVLEDKNRLIEANAKALDSLNKEISRKNESLSESNEMKDKLLSIISHDLRSPLANTKGLLELVNEELLNEEEKKDLFEKLEDQYVRSITLLDNLLFWIKGQVNGDKVKEEKIELQKLLFDVIEENRISLDNKKICAFNNVSDKVTVKGDKEMLKIVFRNLLSNSIKFTPNNTKINFSATENHEVEIVLKDEGIGMSEEALRKIRSRKYFTTRGTDNELGSGFGLMLCEDLIKKQQGELTIESEPGKGSSFIIKLPRYPDNN